MSSFSKLFPGALDAVSCREAFHPDGSCWHAAAANFSQPLPSCAKFFMPIFCFQLLRRILAGNYTRETLPELFDDFVRTTLTGYLGSAFGQTLCCITYNMLGKMYLHTTVLLPVCIGNLWGFAMPTAVNRMFSDYLAMMVMEAYYRCDETFVLRLIRQSPAFRTAMFMAMSAAILNTHRSLKTDVMWFVQTFRKRTPALNGGNDSNGNGTKPQLQQQQFTQTVRPSPIFDRWLPVSEHVCHHPGSCDDYVLQGIQSNVKIGVIIEFVRFVIENMMRLRRKPTLLLSCFSQMKVHVISFFIGYTSVYRIINCSLNRYQQRDSQRANTIAAFVAGSVFWLYPDLTILSHASVSTVKVLWLRYLNGGTCKNQLSSESRLRQVLVLLDRLPMSRLMYVFAIGYVFHLRLFYPWVCSDLLFKTTFYTSGFISDRVTLNVAKHTLGAAA